MPEPITKAKILLVEGQDEVNLFDALLSDLGLSNSIQVIQVGGKEKFVKVLPGLVVRSDFGRVSSIGIIRDADRDPLGAFQSICGALSMPMAKLPVPKAPLIPTVGFPQVIIMIVPDADVTGMIEDICLDSISDDPAMDCVEQYFQCLQEKSRVLAENVIPKARVRAFLASRELLEITYFEHLQRCLDEYDLNLPLSSSNSVPKTHVFLASRYTPDLSLGIAAQKSGSDDRYWQFDHPAFDKIKHFLQML